MLSPTHTYSAAAYSSRHQKKSALEGFEFLSFKRLHMSQHVDQFRDQFKGSPFLESQTIFESQQDQSEKRIG